MIQKISNTLNLNTAMYPTGRVSQKTDISVHETNNPQKIFSDLSLIASLNSSLVSFKGLNNKKKTDFEFNMSMDELKRRTSDDGLVKYNMLKPDSVEFAGLKDGDKQALAHLVKASRALSDVFFQQDNAHNLSFRDYLEEKIEDGDEIATLTKKLFDAQCGVCGKDFMNKPVNLAKGIEPFPGKGFYPESLGKDEFHKILINMLKNGKDDEVRSILNQRTMIVRAGDELRGIDYTDYFKKEFTEAASELLKAAKTSTNEEFNRYLKLQAKALLENNPQLDADADKQWATLQFTPLEFTIARESYDDRMTPTVNENKELKQMLDERGIIPYAKDTLGVRVGIVNKEGTDFILGIKDYLPLMAENMPFTDEYEQKIGAGKKLKQSMVDADIVDMSGHCREFKGGISIASNLPNGDKLAVKQGGGFRNVYHKQIREGKSQSGIDEKLNAILNPAQHKYYNSGKMHMFTILHENIHSLGPKEGMQGLGVLKNTIEENKADMGAIAMLEPLMEAGVFSADDVKQFLVTYFVGYAPTAPNFENAHRRRNIMQHNYFINKGAVSVDDDGKMTIYPQKCIETAKQMLAEVIRVQLDGDFDKAETYVNRWGVWTPELDKIASSLNKIKRPDNGVLVTELADKLADSLI